MRILVVDDEPFIRELLIQTLAPLGYEVAEASDGHAALARVESFRPAVVILDVTMPGLDGYEVLGRLRSTEEGRRIFILMLTARADLEDLERGLVSGADDYLAKPFHLRELVARIRAAARVLTLQEELLLKNTQLSESLSLQERLNRKMTAEMEMAARLQAAILPPRSLDQGRLRVRALSRPSRAVGGDYYDLRRLDARTAGVFLADAAGHGVSAALLGAMLKTALENALASSFQPAPLLAALNRSFQFCAEHAKYLTAFFCTLDDQSGETSYALAGHTPPLLRRSATGTIQKLDAPGYCLGVFAEGEYEERRTRLEPGDLLLACTDGVADASPDDGAVFGERLPDLLARTAGCGAQGTLAAVDSALIEFLGGAPPPDDCTILCLELLPQGR